jgi:hypothetical protein
MCSALQPKHQHCTLVIAIDQVRRWVLNNGMARGPATTPSQGVRLSRTMASRPGAVRHDKAKLVERLLTRHRGKFDMSPFGGTTEAADEGLAYDLLRELHRVLVLN